MDIATIPPTVYVAFGVITASLLAGFFSFVNMVSSKENKVSEFRLAWIDGLRDEISEYTSAAQELVRLGNLFEPEPFHTEAERHALNIEWYKESRDAFSRATENLSKIQLRLNPEHAKNNPDSPEANLIKAVETARQFSIAGDFESVVNSCADIRNAAAPILKSTWNLVKRGETGYRRIRRYSFATVAFGFYAIIFFGSYVGYNNYKAERQNSHEKTIKLARDFMTQLQAQKNKDNILFENECKHSNSIPYRLSRCR